MHPPCAPKQSGALDHGNQDDTSYKGKTILEHWKAERVHCSAIYQGVVIAQFRMSLADVLIIILVRLLANSDLVHSVRLPIYRFAGRPSEEV